MLSLAHSFEWERFTPNAELGAGLFAVTCWALIRFRGTPELGCRDGKLESHVYASRELFRKLWPKLIKSGCVEAFAELKKDAAIAPAPSIAAVETFLADAEKPKPAEKDVNGRTRVYYSLTSGGRRHLKKITRDWRRISGGVDAALLDPNYA